MRRTQGNSFAALSRPTLCESFQRLTLRCVYDDGAHGLRVFDRLVHPHQLIEHCRIRLRRIYPSDLTLVEPEPQQRQRGLAVKDGEGNGKQFSQRCEFITRHSQQERGIHHNRPTGQPASRPRVQRPRSSTITSWSVGLSPIHKCHSARGHATIREPPARTGACARHLNVR